MTQDIRILIVDDHPLFREGLRQMIDHEADLTVCGEAPDAESALEAIEELKALGYPLYPGALGENLTTEGLDRTSIRVGQHYRAGDAILEITKLRQPAHDLRGSLLG